MPSTSVRVQKKAGFELPSIGLGIATLYAVTDLGLVTPRNPAWKPRPKVRLEFAMAENDASGRPITLRVDMSRSLWERSLLSQYVDALCGDGTAQAIPVGQEIELTDLIGRSLQLMIEHHKGTDGKVWANVKAVTALAPGQVGVSLSSLQPKVATVTQPAVPEPVPVSVAPAAAPLYKLPNAGAASSYVIGQTNGGVTK